MSDELDVRALRVDGVYVSDDLDVWPYGDDSSVVFLAAIKPFTVDGIEYSRHTRGVCSRPMIELLEDHECHPSSPCHRM